MRSSSNILVQDLVDLILVILEFVGFSGLRGVVVPQCLLLGHEVVEAHVGFDGDGAVEKIVAALFGANQFQIVSELVDALDPLGLLSLMSSSLVLHEDGFLSGTILDVANGEISTLLDNSFKRPLFLLYPVELFLREVVGQGVVPEVVDRSFQGPGRLDLIIVEFRNGPIHVLFVGQ